MSNPAGIESQMADELLTPILEKERETLDAIERDIAQIIDLVDGLMTDKNGEPTKFATVDFSKPKKLALNLEYLKTIMLKLNDVNFEKLKPQIPLLDAAVVDNLFTDFLIGDNDADLFRHGPLFKKRYPKDEKFTYKIKDDGEVWIGIQFTEEISEDLISSMMEHVFSKLFSFTLYRALLSMKNNYTKENLSIQWPDGNHSIPFSFPVVTEGTKIIEIASSSIAYFVFEPSKQKRQVTFHVEVDASNLDISEMSRTTAIQKIPFIYNIQFSYLPTLPTEN